MTRLPSIPAKAELLMPETAGRQAWLQARSLGIGGSDIGALIGVSEYATPFDVFRAKTAVAGEVIDISDRPEIEWGHRLEEAVARKTADELGLVARTGGGLWRHADHEVVVVTPDRIATKRRSWTGVGVIEAKTVGAGDDDAWHDGGAPLSYQAQVQWQLGILGFDVGWLGCLVLGRARDFHVVEVRFDRDWFDEMVREAERFWTEHVLTGEPPMHDLDHPHTAELLKELHPRVVQPAMELPEDAPEWIENYRRAKAEAERAEAELERAKNWFRMTLEDAGAGYIGDQKVVSFPEVHVTRIDTKKLRESHPAVADECSVTSTHRRLTVRAVKAPN